MLRFLNNAPVALPTAASSAAITATSGLHALKCLHRLNITAQHHHHSSSQLQHQRHQTSAHYSTAAAPSCAASSSASSSSFITSSFASRSHSLIVRPSTHHIFSRNFSSSSDKPPSDKSGPPAASTPAAESSTNKPATTTTSSSTSRPATRRRRVIREPPVGTLQEPKYVRLDADGNMYPLQEGLKLKDTRVHPLTGQLMTPEERRRERARLMKWSKRTGRPVTDKMQDQTIDLETGEVKTLTSKLNPYPVQYDHDGTIIDPLAVLRFKKRMQGPEGLVPRPTFDEQVQREWMQTVMDNVENEPEEFDDEEESKQDDLDIAETQRKIDEDNAIIAAEEGFEAPPPGSPDLSIEEGDPDNFDEKKYIDEIQLIQDYDEEEREFGRRRDEDENDDDDVLEGPEYEPLPPPQYNASGQLVNREGQVLTPHEIREMASHRIRHELRRRDLLGLDADKREIPVTEEFPIMDEEDMDQKPETKKRADWSVDEDGKPIKNKEIVADQEYAEDELEEYVEHVQELTQDEIDHLEGRGQEVDMDEEADENEDEDEDVDEDEDEDEDGQKKQVEAEEPEEVIASTRGLDPLARMSNEEFERLTHVFDDDEMIPDETYEAEKEALEHHAEEQDRKARLHELGFVNPEHKDYALPTPRDREIMRQMELAEGDVPEDSYWGREYQMMLERHQATDTNTPYSRLDRRERLEWHAKQAKKKVADSTLKITSRNPHRMNRRPHPKRLRRPDEEFAGFWVSCHSSMDPRVRILLAANTRLNDPEQENWHEYEAMMDSIDWEEPEDLSQTEWSKLEEKWEQKEAYRAKREREQTDRNGEPLESAEDILQNPTVRELLDPNHGWELKNPRFPLEKLTEIIHFFDPYQNRTVQYVIDGPDTPPTVWPPASLHLDPETGKPCDADDLLRNGLKQRKKHVDDDEDDERRGKTGWLTRIEKKVDARIAREEEEVAMLEELDAIEAAEEGDMEAAKKLEKLTSKNAKAEKATKEFDGEIVSPEEAAAADEVDVDEDAQKDVAASADEERTIDDEDDAAERHSQREAERLRKFEQRRTEAEAKGEVFTEVFVPKPGREDRTPEQEAMAVAKKRKAQDKQAAREAKAKVLAEKQRLEEEEADELSFLEDDADADEPEKEEKEGAEAVEAKEELDEEEEENIPIPAPRVWLTWSRTWENLRKNGIEPTQEELDFYLTDILGMPKHKLKVHRPTFVRAEKEIFQETLGMHYLLPQKPGYNELGSWNGDMSSYNAIPFPKYNELEYNSSKLVMTEEEWNKYVAHSQSLRSTYVETKKIYKQKLHQTRVAYLTEYKRIRAMHEANILARWNQHEQQRKEKREWKARRRVIQLQRAAAYYDRFAARREKLRQKSRFTRQNKEMKQRRHAIHSFNYILKEREYHWIQPQKPKQEAAAAKAPVVHSVNLTTKLFDRQENLTGFWPRPADQDMAERKEEEYRRRLIKEQQ